MQRIQNAQHILTYRQLDPVDPWGPQGRWAIGNSAKIQFLTRTPKRMPADHPDPWGPQNSRASRQPATGALLRRMPERMLVECPGIRVLGSRGLAGNPPVTQAAPPRKQPYTTAWAPDGRRALLGQNDLHPDSYYSHAFGSASCGAVAIDSPTPS